MAIDQALIQQVTTWRHDFHQHPELSNQEFETTRKIKEILEGWNIDILTTGLKTGVVAQIIGGQPGKKITLRADIDALPVTEKTDLAFKSQNEGVMHACGHDLHLSSLLGAAYILKQHAKEFSGTIQLLFQPAEEVGRGGDQVIEQHVLDDTDAIVGFHNNPNLPVGTIGLKSGALMAGCYHFVIDIHGAGSHGARPEKGHDPIVAQAAIISQLQTIVSRSVRPLDTVVVSVTKVHGGETWNVIPETVQLEGTVRTFDDYNTELVRQRLTKIAQQVAESFDETADVDWSVGAAPIDNDARLTDLIASEVDKHATVIEPELSMAGEDFATFQQKVPGVFAFIGSNGAANVADWHDPSFIGLDETLPIGIQYFVDATNALLKK